MEEVEESQDLGTCFSQYGNNEGVVMERVVRGRQITVSQENYEK